MKRNETVLYNRLMKICAADTETAKFFFKDFKSSMGTKFRVFSYHIASYTDWLQPGAGECRGIMFEMNELDKPVRIAARPMHKFFNLNENPMTMGLDLSKVEYAMAKEDGSLVSSYIDQGYVYLKSKTSIFSDQAISASSLLNTESYFELQARVKQLAEDGYTVNFEYVSPYNRIVLQYKEAKLIVLNVRNNVTGEYVSYDDLYKDAAIRPYLVVAHRFEPFDDSVVQTIREQNGIEGFVFVSGDTWFKLKTDWYCALHHTKDSINNNKRLFSVVANSGSDDLRAMFSTDQEALDKIQEFEEIYMWTLERHMSLVCELYHQLAGKDRRTYAIEAQEALGKANERELFSIVMKQFIGLDTENVVKSVSDTFLKNCEKYIPAKYK